MKARVAHLVAFIAILAGCGQYLHQFADEDREITLEILSDTTASPTFTVATRLVGFDITFRADRTGTYRILHGTNCSATQAAGGTNVSGNFLNAVTVAATISLPYDDLALHGRQITVCVQDVAAYKTASLTKSFGN